MSLYLGIEKLGLSSIFLCQSRYFFVSGDNWETPSNDLWGEVPRLLHRWGMQKLGASSFCKCLFLRSLLSSLL